MAGSSAGRDVVAEFIAAKTTPDWICRIREIGVTRKVEREKFACGEEGDFLLVGVDADSAAMTEGGMAVEQDDGDVSEC